MSENELYMDVLAGKRPDGSNVYVRDLLAEVQSARGAALEEAASELMGGANPYTSYSAADAARHVRALKSQPARRYLDAEKVQATLEGVRLVSPGLVDPRTFIDDLARRLGLDLDAAPERKP